MRMGFVYNQWDYGYRDQPIPSRADFGGRGNSFGLGAMDQGSYHYSDTIPVADPQLQQLEIDAANEQVRVLQYQIDALQKVDQNAVTQAQLSALQKELASAKTVASSGFLQAVQANMPYIALGVGALMVVMMLKSFQRRIA